jgi:hypothetical protein
MGQGYYYFEDDLPGIVRLTIRGTLSVMDVETLVEEAQRYIAVWNGSVGFLVDRCNTPVPLPSLARLSLIRSMRGQRAIYTAVFGSSVKVEHSARMIAHVAHATDRVVILPTEREARAWLVARVASASGLARA